MLSLIPKRSNIAYTHKRNCIWSRPKTGYNSAALHIWKHFATNLRAKMKTSFVLTIQQTQFEDTPTKSAFLDGRSGIPGNGELIRATSIRLIHGLCQRNTNGNVSRRRECATSCINKWWMMVTSCEYRWR